VGPHWSQVRLGAKILSATLTFLAGLALAGHEAELWQFSPREEFRLASVSITLLFLSLTASAIHQWRSEKSEVTLRNIRQGVTYSLHALLFRIQDETGIDVRDLGATVHLRVRTGIWPFHHEQLVPLAWARFRATSVSGITWRPGVGVIGRCVTLGRLLIVDVAALDRQLESLTEAEWHELAQREQQEPPEQSRTLGMSYREWQRARGKFSVILATPLIGRSSTRSEILGCVSVDVMTPDPSTDSYELLSEEAVQYAVSAAAREISNVLAAFL
jgi:hypothetical protein